MITQIAMYMTDSTVKVSKEEKKLLKTYPGLQVVWESNKFPYTLKFIHEKNLTAKKVGLSKDWVIGPETYIESPIPVLPGKK